jgi:hypothetical protein
MHQENWRMGNFLFLHVTVSTIPLQLLKAATNPKGLLGIPMYISYDGKRTGIMALSPDTKDPKVFTTHMHTDIT